MEFKLTNTDGKIEKLLQERGIDLREIKKILDAGDWLGMFRHPQRENQMIFVVEVDNYCWLVPVVDLDLTIKTAMPSRKMTKKYLGDSNNE